MDLACEASLKIKFEILPLPHFFDLYPKRICGTLTTSHRRITTFWHNIPVWKNFFNNDTN
jgi:hypothetical protein